MTSSLLIDPREWEKLKTPIPAVGDAVSIDTFIPEGEKYRVQNYCGTLIARHKRGRHTTITVRRVFQGVGIERIFPAICCIDSPNPDSPSGKDSARKVVLFAKSKRPKSSIA
jgi:ribosomal protein L19